MRRSRCHRFVVDGSTGVTDEDEEVARIVRKSDKPVFLVVNKKITLLQSRMVFGTSMHLVVESLCLYLPLMVTVLVTCWMTLSTHFLR